jgi:hypothetical protein
LAKEGVTAEEYYTGKKEDDSGDDQDEEILIAGGEAPPDRDKEIKMMEFITDLYFSTRKDELRHMYASVCIPLFKGHLDKEKKKEIADHFDKTPERVNQVIKEVQNFAKKGLNKKELA